MTVAQNPTSSWPCIIFRPGVPVGVGRYLVKVAGIESTNSAPAPLVYAVDIRELAKPVDSSPNVPDDTTGPGATKRSSPSKKKRDDNDGD